MFKSQLKALSVIVFSSLIISQSYSADDNKKLDVSEAAFKCISEFAASGRFFVDNILGNLDATLIAQAPKLAPHIPQMRQRLAATMAVGTDRLNIKATTTENLGFCGRGEGIAAQAIVLLLQK